MNKPPENPFSEPKTAPLLPADKADDSRKEAKDEKSQEAPLPLIAAFFSDPKISPSVFFKVLKSEKVKRFKKDDADKTLELLVSMDPNGDRLWALMSQSTLPEAVDRWIWPIAQDRLCKTIGSDFDPYGTDASKILKILRDTLIPRLNSKEKEKRKSAENYLRIGICWLAEKRSIQLWSIAEIISSALFQDRKSASRLVSRAIRKGRLNAFKLAVAMSCLGNEMVTKAKSDRDDERQLSNNLRIQLSLSESKNERLNAEHAVTRTVLELKSEALKAIETQLENERHHWGHDLSETKAKQRVLLGERMAPMLSDAIDALEIEPPAPHVALKRLKAVLSMMEKEKP